MAFVPKYQLVNLRACGIRDRRLDNRKPSITVRDWYSARRDCGAEYILEVQLLADDKETELASCRCRDTKEEGTDWTIVKHIFKNYPSGVRFVKFQHGGKDTRYWAGHYGIKMTNSGLFVGQRGGKRKGREVLSKLGENLLKNPCGDGGLNDWEVVKHGGNGFSCETTPDGCKPIKTANTDATYDCCWSTSNGECEKKQLIDLAENGFSSEFLDEEDIQIKICEWLGCRYDAGCEYWLNVRLLNSDMQEIGVRYYKDFKPAEGDWYKVELSFSDCAPGARFIEYSHGGKDNCNWAGHYGAKIACSSVKIFAEGSSDSSSEEEN